jgi:hypothetical protein
MATTTPNYAVDYEDERLTTIKSEEQTQLEQNAQMYDGMIQGVDEQYKGIADTIQSNADKLAQTQQENTDFQVQQIEQQKEQAQKDYTKEQSGAYVDFQKQSNQYGVNAEQMAMQGLAGSGYSESSKVAMYNQYQNRVAVARETLSKVIMNYDNNIQQAILQNNSTIAQIQSEASLKQAEILLEGFNQKNTLLQQQMEREMQLKSLYQNKWQSELDQINKENALAEEVRQAQIRQEQWQEEQRIAQEQWQKQYDLAETEAKQQADIREREMKIKEAEEERNAEAYSNAKQGTVKPSAKQQTPVIEYDPYAKKETVSMEQIAKNTSYVNLKTPVSTPFYQGKLNPGVSKYGAYNSKYEGIDYQPKGVIVTENGKTKDYGKITKVEGETIEVKSVVKYGQYKGTTVTSTQSVWKTKDGKKWYWDGTNNTYVRIKK